LRIAGCGLRVAGFKVRGSEVPFLALRASQGKQGLAAPPAKKTAGQIEKETLKKANNEYRTRNNESSSGGQVSK
jgi:hypothetical protein